MGYRSDVKSIVYGDAELMSEFISENTELLEALQDDFDGHIETIEKPARTFILLTLDYVKWDEGDSDVIRWMNLLKLADEYGLKFEFARVGEHRSDVEYNHSNRVVCDYFLSVVTTIEVNF
jgi:hypothetical protein